MSEAVSTIIVWWFGLFGITEQAYLKLGVTLVATASLLVAFWLLMIIVLGLFSALTER